jgi:hypothetical protein
MGFWRFARYAIGAGLAGLLLTSCGEPLSGTQRALPPDASQARAQRASRSSGELVYAITAKGIVVFSYPKWSIVARISGSGIWFSVCSDPNTGNVFAVAGSKGDIDEYAHGGTMPIAELTPPSGYHGFGACAVDPKTGNLAAISAAPNGRQAVLVYHNASGTPKAYTDKELPALTYPAYDGAGNLFVGATNKFGAPLFGELRAHHKQFIVLDLGGDTILQKLQWDGTYLVFEVSNSPKLGTTVNQVKISGKTATIVGSIQLKHCLSNHFWIDDGSLIGFYYPPASHHKRAIATWSYPAGGMPTSRFFGLARGPQGYAYDLTVSVAPSGSRRTP